MYLNVKLLIRVLIIASVLNEFESTSMKEQCPNVKSSLGYVRKRRHLAFPEGSSVSVTTSVVKTFMTHVPSGWYMVIEVELVYKLPDSKAISANLRRKLHHRQKREFWEVLQNAFEQRNLNGRACVIRTVCEAEINLAPPGKSLVHDILRVIFTAPLNEDDFVEEMGASYSEIKDPKFCERGLDCPFSCIKFILDLNKQNI